MQHALRLARRNLGQTWPNPAVGAVIVKNEQIIGIGWTARGGRPHAEPQAINMAGADAKGATLYVTLEPCAHHGKTPPCAEAIIKAGIARVIVACGDPHPEVNGKGIAVLRNAGIQVVENICREEAERVNAGFFSVVKRRRPHLALKIATSLDERILPGDGKPRWVTGERARAFAHRLRAEHDAILTGIGTVLADDPLLSCRLPGMESRSPVRLVLDRQGRLPNDSQLMQTAEQVPLWVENDTDALETVLQRLADRGITRLLVEAGPTLTSAFLNAGLVDRLYWFRGAQALGESGVAAILSPLPAMHPHEAALTLGQDTLDIYDLSTT